MPQIKARNRTTKSKLLAPHADRTFQIFAADVERLLGGVAAGKGYNQTGPNNHNELYEFVEGMNVGPGHALGEVVYKAKRYAAKRNPEDVLKIAAWAFLIWKHHR